MNLAKQLKVLFIAALLLLFIPVQGIMAAADSPTWIVKTNYVALGDSLAAGVTPDNQLGKGYADMIAEKIAKEDALASYNKGFSQPGYTTADVLTDIKKNVVRDVYGSGYTSKTASIKDTLKKADIVTISAGANDLLKHVKANSLSGTLEYDEKDLATAITEVSVNLNNIQKEIKALNPDVKIFVMGYYNPFPYLADDAQPMVQQLLTQFNKAIAASTAGTDAVYIETKDEIAKEYKKFLPNPQNIHLSVSGYETVTQLFWAKIQSYKWIPTDSVKASEIKANSVRLSWTKPTSSSPIATYEIFDGEKLVATVGADKLSATVEGLTEKKEYHLIVVAIDEKGRKSHPNLEIKVKTADAEPLFSDLKEEWSKEYVKRAVEAGLIKGYSDGTFKPYQPLTRVQAAAILVRTLKLETNDKITFTDMDGFGKETQREISAAYKYGLVKGTNGKFMPSKEVTRAQIALMVHRAIEFKAGKEFNASALAPYTDFGAYDEDTVNSISVLYQLGIATGSNGKFSPSSSTTRQQAVKIFVNTMDTLAK